MNADKPLVTISMMTYNQEKYVRDAVRGLLGQTYEPLEIVISDDCSTDKTWEIINEEIDKYKVAGGIHKNIVLNRNEKNLGIACHMSRVTTFFNGVLMVACAGDDISLPNRVEKIVEAWCKSGQSATVIFHDGLKINLAGEVIGTIGRRDVDSPLGACMSYCFAKMAGAFGKIEEDGAFEDHVLGRRAILLGEVLILDDKLIKYRVGSGVSSVLHERRAPELRSAVGRAASYRQNLRDVEYWHGKGNLTDEVFDALVGKYTARRNEMEALIKLITGSSFFIRWAAFKQLYLSKLKIKEAVLKAPYLLPKSIGDAIYKFYDSRRR